MAHVTIRSIGVLSLAKIQGTVLAVFGIFIGVIYGLMFLVLGAVGSGGGGSRVGGAGMGIAMGLGAMIAMPIFYGIAGFIGGAISALIYNVAAGMMGGVELELQSNDA